MLSTVFAKTVRDRWRGTAVTVVSLALMLLFAMAAYREFDVGIYDELPEAMRVLIGVPPGADIAALAYSVIFSSYGALALGGLAIAMGAASIAAEESAGSIGLLLGSPVSRTRVLAGKAGALLLLVTVATLALWGAGRATPELLDVSITGMHVGPFSLHFGLSSAFYGLLALAVGAWTGRRGLAAGTASGVMVLSFFAVGLLPLVSGWEDLARAFPWYYLNGSQPLLNGVHWGHVGILAGASLALLALAVVGVNRRDLRARSIGVTVLDRLRTHPLTKAIVERLQGSARVSRIWLKTASEHQGLLIVVAAIMVWVMGVMMGPIYAGMSETLLAVGEGFPEGLLIFFGGGDLSTVEGFYQVEVFGMMAPIAVLVVTISIGARALAGEEENRTIGLLLANPVPRTALVREKAATMVLFGAAVGAVIFAGVAGGSWISGVGLDVGNVAAAALLATLVGLVFGALALFLSASTGRARLAIFVPTGAAVAFHVMNSLAEINDAAWGQLSPFYYYISSDPLRNGLDWGHAALLTALAAALVLLALPTFERRDLRQTS